jgi:hypothetical protein
MSPGTESTDCVRGFIAVESVSGSAVRYKAFPMRCKSWDCPHCAKIKAEKYRVRMQPLFDRERLFFYTFTFYHDRPELEVWESVQVAWNRFRTAASKKYGRFSYVRVLEHHHSSDYPHLHIIADARFSDVWLAAELRNAGFGYQAKVKEVTSEGAAAYISKYLTKPWNSPACRLIRKNLRLRLISFGGTACTRASCSGDWNLLAMALDVDEALDAISRDVVWRYGTTAIKTYENTGFDSYELTILIPEVPDVPKETSCVCAGS